MRLYVPSSGVKARIGIGERKRAMRRAKEGENVIIVAGSPPGIPGSTNAMRVHRVGDAVGGVVPAYR